MTAHKSPSLSVTACLWSYEYHPFNSPECAYGCPAMVAGQKIRPHPCPQEESSFSGRTYSVNNFSQSCSGAPDLVWDAMEIYIRMWLQITCPKTPGPLQTLFFFFLYFMQHRMNTYRDVQSCDKLNLQSIPLIPGHPKQVLQDLHTNVDLNLIASCLKQCKKTRR